MSAEWAEILELIGNAGATLQPGLTASELAAAEDLVGAPFPPDLRALLATALPSGLRFPNWRRLDEAVRVQMLWPLEGIEFDVEHNAFWVPEWGRRPDDVEAAQAIARARVAEAPRLVPVHGHRYIPTEPSEAGNPVLSVNQTDIIVYGDDLRSYLEVEFGGRRYEDGVRGKARHIRFWSDLTT